MKREIIFDKDFDFFETDEKSAVFQVFPALFEDNRGFFCEIGKSEITNVNRHYDWLTDFSWIRQINRSKSSANTVRGCHAQAGKNCQGKLVTAITHPIYDIITDGRPQSKTFGKTKIYKLDPIRQNMLWVPHGFLHGFCTETSDEQYYFEYFCDNVYDKENEFSVSIFDVMRNSDLLQSDVMSRASEIIFACEKDGNISNKDKSGKNFKDWSADIMSEYVKTGRIWYDK